MKRVTYLKGNKKGKSELLSNKFARILTLTGYAAYSDDIKPVKKEEVKTVKDKNRKTSKKANSLKPEE